MCGFAGFCNISDSQIFNPEKLLDAMQLSISHRGPDDQGIWLSHDAKVGLINRRLSIVDLTPHGHQPMLDAQERVVISFNGEIYNYLDIRRELQSKGYKFKSTGDTEVLLYAYHEWGIGFLHKLDGMFAFALFDQEKNELFLVRDRIGVKPLYFALQNGILSFASEIKALWQLPWNKREISSIALYHYLTFMVSPAPYTLYEKVYKLPAGFYAKIDQHKALSFHEWYSPLKTPPLHEQSLLRQEEYCKEKVESLLIKAVKKRMVSDVPVGAFLSGGLDSSLNVALMAHYSSSIKTFTVSFEDMPSEDVKAAQLVAKQFGTDHYHIVISEKEAYDFYHKMVYYLDEPLADCVCIPFYFVAKLARENNVKVVQVGEGADELFYGYPVYIRYKKFYETFFSPLQKVMPKAVRKTIGNSIKWLFPKRPDYVEFSNNWAEDRYCLWGGAVAFGEYHKKKILANTLFSSADLVQQDSIVASIYGGLKQNFDSFSIVDYHLQRTKSFFKSNDFLRQLLYFELKQRLPELLLMRADKMSMATSVEAREPFLDYQLVECMLQIPSEINCYNNENKYLLKQIALRYLPERIVNRKKVGFSAPTQYWYKHGNYFPQLFNQQSCMCKDSTMFKPETADIEHMFAISDSVLAVQKWTLQNIWSVL